MNKYIKMFYLNELKQLKTKFDERLYASNIFFRSFVTSKKN